MQAPSERSAVETASMMCSRAVSVLAEQAARIGDAIGLVDREGQRQRVDHFAAFDSGACPALHSRHGGCPALPPRARRPAIAR